MKRFKLAVLSTYYENIGDDLIRMGIVSVLDELKLDYRLVRLSKSNELSLIADFGYFTHSPRWQKDKTGKRLHDAVLRRVPEFVKRIFTKHRLSDTDALIVAGTPLFYFTHKRFTFLNKGYWAKKIIGKFLVSGKPVFVIGTGFILDDEPEKIAQRCPEELSFLKKLIEKAAYFSVRDSISYSFLKSVLPGYSFERTHCPSLWNVLENRTHEPKLILISYSEESSRVDAAANESVSKRRNVFSTIVQFLKKENYQINLVCHNQVDLNTQMSMYKEFNLPKPLMPSAADMEKVFGNAAFVITWRVHGAMAARLANTPVLLFKTDNRYQMAEEVGAFTLDDREMSVDVIIEKLNYFLSPVAQQSSVKVPDMSAEKKLLREKLIGALTK